MARTQAGGDTATHYVPTGHSRRPTSGTSGTSSGPEVIRLSINLAPDVARTLKELAASKGVSVTEAIRRAIAVWKFVEDERSAGHRLAVIETDGKTERIREVVLL